MYITRNNRIREFEYMNRNVIKYIVIILMLFDHISYFLPAASPIVIFIGMISRLTAPTMALSAAEGYHYTRDIHKYMKRMIIFAVISYIPYVLYRTANLIPIQLFSGSTFPEFFRATGAIVVEPSVYISAINSLLVVHETSVIFTLFLGLFTIYLWDKINIPKILKLIITLFILWISAFSNWHYCLILLCLVFYFCRDNPKKMWALFTIVAFLYIFSIRLFADPFHLAFSMNFELFRIGIFLVPFFFAFYNGEAGTKSAFNKWFFYIFYPAHLLVLGLIRIFITG